MQTIVAIDVNMVNGFVYYMNVPLFLQVSSYFSASTEYLNAYAKIIKELGQRTSLEKLKTAVFRCRILVACGLASIVSFVSCSIISSLDSRYNFILFTVITVNEQLLILLGSYLLGWDYVTVIKNEPTNKNYQETRSVASSFPAS